MMKIQDPHNLGDFVLYYYYFYFVYWLYPYPTCKKFAHNDRQERI